MEKTPGKIVFYDGDCVLCNHFVEWILLRNVDPKLYFASLQAPIAGQLLHSYSIDPQARNTVYFLDEGELYDRSTAALHITKYLTGLWPAIYALIVVPRGIRDSVYRWIASNRYRWFGKNATCDISYQKKYVDRIIA